MKEIKGYPNLYINDNLDIFSNYINNQNKKGQFKLLKQSNSDGYFTVYCNYKSYLVHRLIAIAFIDNPNNKKEVNHINGNKGDNRIENLEWCTRKENSQHAWDIGLNKSKKQRLQSNLINKKITLRERLLKQCDLVRVSGRSKQYIRYLIIDKKIDIVIQHGIKLIKINKKCKELLNIN